MRWLMADCGKVQGRINTTPLAAGGLSRLVSRYNECIDGKRAEARQRSKQFVWHAGAIVMYSEGKLKGINDDVYIWTDGSGAAVLLKDLADYDQLSSITPTSYG